MSKSQILVPFNQKSAILLELVSGKIVTTGGRPGGSTKANTRIGEYEKEFKISVSRVKINKKTAWGTSCSFYQYRLNPTRNGNKAGIKRIIKYLTEGQKK